MRLMPKPVQISAQVAEAGLKLSSLRKNLSNRDRLANNNHRSHPFVATSGTCVTGEGGEHHDAQSAGYYRVELNGGFWPISAFHDRLKPTLNGRSPWSVFRFIKPAAHPTALPTSQDNHRDPGR
jgi:hypothetical protein